MLEFRNLSYRYPDSDAYIFKDLNGRVSEPGFHALFGMSGVGKTTLARIIAGELNGFSGEVRLPSSATVLYSGNFEKLPGWCSVTAHLREVTPPAHRQRIDELVSAFGIERCMPSRFSQLSLGQQNRVNLTRYLLQEFDFLIMDESLGNVDEATREQIILKIKRMFPGKWFLYISHNVVEVSKFCRAVLVLRGLPKHPQALAFAGRNYAGERTPTSRELETTMLEIVHAS
jgi:ABC-type multidrug transport system ATPase subunit